MNASEFHLGSIPFQSTSARSWRRLPVAGYHESMNISIHFSAKLKTVGTIGIIRQHWHFNPLQREAEVVWTRSPTMKDCYFNPLQREAEDLQGRLQADTQNISIHFSAKLKTYHRHTAGNPVVFQSTSARSWRLVVMHVHPCFTISIHFSAKLKT